jgi:hypothetical protein
MNADNTKRSDLGLLFNLAKVYRHHASLVSLQQSARDGCPICKLFFDGFPWNNLYIHQTESCDEIGGVDFAQTMTNYGTYDYRLRGAHRQIAWDNGIPYFPTTDGSPPSVSRRRDGDGSGALWVSRWPGWVTGLLMCMEGKYPNMGHMRSTAHVYVDAGMHTAV